MSAASPVVLSVLEERGILSCSTETAHYSEFGRAVARLF